MKQNPAPSALNSQKSPARAEAEVAAEHPRHTQQSDSSRWQNEQRIADFKDKLVTLRAKAKTLHQADNPDFKALLAVASYLKSAYPKDHLAPSDSEMRAWRDQLEALELKEPASVNVNAVLQKELSESFRLAERELASEKLGGNVVKEEYWKGELAVLHRLRRLLREHSNAAGAALGKQEVGDVKRFESLSYESEITAHFDHANSSWKVTLRGGRIGLGPTLRFAVDEALSQTPAIVESLD